MTVVGIAFLAILLFCPDVTALDIERVIELTELARIDDAICMEMAFHGADPVLFVHQFAKLDAGQADIMHAGPDAFRPPVAVKAKAPSIIMPRVVFIKVLFMLCSRSVKGGTDIWLR